MSWYRTGTVTVTNGSPNVTLAGGDALQNIFPEDGFVGPDGRTYAINTIGGAGSFTLQTNYLGSTAAGQNYLIVPTANYVQLRDALEAINTLITQYQDITLKAGVGRFEPGNTASPGVRGIGHEGTGLVWDGDESLSVSVAGTIMATFGPTGTSWLNSDVIRTNNIRATGNIELITGKDRFVQIGSSSNYSYRLQTTSDDFQIIEADNVAVRVTIKYPNGFVGIGTATPAEKLEVYSGGSGVAGNIQVGNAATAMIVGVDPSNACQIRTAQAVPMIFYNSSIERMRFTPAGQLLIGRTGWSGLGRLNVEGGADFTGGNIWLARDAGAVQIGPGSLNGRMQINGGHSGCFVRLQSSGDGGTDDASIDWFASQPNVAYSGGGFGYNINATRYAGKRRSGQGAASIEFASDGVLSVYQATTAQSTLTQRLQLTPTGTLYVAADSSGGLTINNLSDAGRGVGLRVTGSGGYGNVDLLTTSPGYNLRVGTGSIATWVFGTDGRFFPTADNGYPIGGPVNRPNVIYAATGTINTSDARSKKEKRVLTAAELRAGARIAQSIGIFEFLEGTREHTGVIAQEIWAIMAEEGLINPLQEGEDPTCKYAFLCYDSWEEQTAPVMATREVEKTRVIPVPNEETEGSPEGEEIPPLEVEEAYTEVEQYDTGEVEVVVPAGDRFSIRPDELAFFIQAAQEQRIQEQETRLANLETLVAALQQGSQS